MNYINYLSNKIKKQYVLLFLFLLLSSLFSTDANFSKWEVEIGADPAISGNVIIFYVHSLEKGRLDYSCLLVKYGRENFDIYLVWNNSKMVIDLHKVIFTFDDDKPEEYICEKSLDLKASLIPYNETEKFITKLKKAKSLTAKGYLYGDTITADFDVSGFFEVYKKYIEIYKF